MPKEFFFISMISNKNPCHFEGQLKVTGLCFILQLFIIQITTAGCNSRLALFNKTPCDRYLPFKGPYRKTYPWKMENYSIKD